MLPPKIALVTCYFQPNYGSQLQAYATQMAFDKLGLDNETICIDGLKTEINKAKYRYFLSRIFVPQTVKDKFRTIQMVWNRKTNKKYDADIKERWGMFADFANTMFHVSRRYNSKSEIAADAHNYCAFVVGSDQLWLPSNIAADYYTLNFVPEDICKISLATSFGISHLPKKQGDLAAKFLKRIDFVSVREDTGKKLVKELADRDVPVVCDPTLMFTANDWNKIVPSERFYSEKYIFCYFLGNNPEQRDFVKKYAMKTGCKIVDMQHCEEFIKCDVGFADYSPYNVGPKEFIQLIRDSEYVFTDSFHCSVFSMLYSRKFFVFRRFNNEGVASTNSRIYSLMSLVHQEQRLLRATENIDECIAMNIDYTQVHADINSLRKFTWDWLQNALKEKCIL